MKKEFVEYINKLFDCEPILINSSLVSAQNRERYYWTNIPGITQPEDRGILLKDIILENSITLKDKSQTILSTLYKENEMSMAKRGKEGLFTFDCKIQEDFYKNRPLREYSDKAPTLRSERHGLKVEINIEELKVPIDKSFIILDKEVQKGKVRYFRKDCQANRVYYVHGKAVTLCGEAGGGAAKMGQYLFGCLTPDRLEKRQNGQRFSKGEKFYTLTAQDQHGILIERYIRKLAPIECERLQTLEDNYTEGISNSQRYKCIGNGWTVDVITHILSFIPKEKI